jgi:hypothetical protein
MMMLLAGLFAASLAMAAWALYDRFEQTNERRLQQQALNRTLERQHLQTCREIEALKAAARASVIKTYVDRKRELELRGLTLTPELERAFKDNRDTRLKLYAARPCPRTTEGR